MSIFTPGYQKPSGIVGPYSYKYAWGPGVPHCSQPPSCCDELFELDFGTTKTVTLDWSATLAQFNECKVLKSDWYIEKESTCPLKASNQQIIGNTGTAIQISGGTHSGEYKLINIVTTEMDTTHRFTVCVKVTGCVTGGLVYVGDACSKKAIAFNVQPAQNCNGTLIPNDNLCQVPSIEYLLTEGMHDLESISETGECITELKLVLVTGSAKFIDSNGCFPISCECPLTVTNGGMCIEDFLVTVSPNSSVKYYKVST